MVIEKEGHDSEENELDLAQPTTYPLEDKYLTPVQRGAGLYIQGEAEWQTTSACRIELAEQRNSRVIVSRWVALGTPSVIVHGGIPNFLDMRGSEQAALLSVAQDGTILNITQDMQYRGLHEMAKHPFGRISLRKARFHCVGYHWSTRRVFRDDIQPGIYAFVSLSDNVFSSRR